MKETLNPEIKNFEHYAENKILDNCWIATRTDGRAFHSEVQRLKLKRPFDKRLRNAIAFASKEVISDFGALFAYVQSDECTFLFSKEFSLFERRHEKLASLIAAKMSACFNRLELTRNSGTVPIFDARIMVLPSKSDVIKCFQWRQRDSHRNCISSYCFWKLVESGKSGKEVQKLLEGKNDAWKNELLFQKYGINYNDTPEWERKGTMLYWVEYEKNGYNPMKKENVIVKRRKVVVEDVIVNFRHDNLHEWINKGIRII